MTVLGVIGATALYLLYGWLLSAIIGSWLSARKGYGEKIGLASGMLVPGINVIVWLVWPARPDSKWKLQGPFGRGGGKTVAEARAEHADAEGPPEGGASGHPVGG